MPWTDWQFWLVTVAAVMAAALVIRPMLPRRGKKSGACPGCASGQAAARPKKTQVTVSGRKAS